MKARIITLMATLGLIAAAFAPLAEAGRQWP
jgi:hypothetical protein